MTNTTTTSRKANKAKTRHRLIQGVLRVLHRQGPAALTTGRIAEAAGVAQPTFYVHFSDMDEALNVAADEIATKLLTRLRIARMDLTGSTQRDRFRVAIERSIDALMAEPKLTELFLRHRRDVGSPLAKKMREMMDRGRADLAEDLLSLELGLDVGEAILHADVVLGMTLGAVEGLLDRRVSDRDACVEVIAHACVASLAWRPSRSLAPAAE
jgi:AcrR family transcriptional regulator